VLFLCLCSHLAVRLREEPIEEVKPHQVMLQFMAAPINPADINMVSAAAKQQTAGASLA